MSRKLTQEQANNKDKNIGAIPIGMYEGACIKREYRCVNCQQSYFAEPHTVRKGQITCVQCSHKRISAKNKLSIKYVRNKIINKGLKPLFNDNDYLNNKTLLKIGCQCGNEFKTSFNSIDRNNTITCGNCKLKRNHKFTSHIALKLHILIEKITKLKWEHNLHIKGCGCIDIANKELKIAIEYDGYYNHKIRNGDRTEKNKEKIQKLIKQGWKILRIKSAGYDIPTEKQLYRILFNDFQHNSRKRTITMKSWKKMGKKYEQK